MKLKNEDRSLEDLKTLFHFQKIFYGMIFFIFC